MNVEIFHQTVSKNTFNYEQYLSIDSVLVCLIDNFHFEYTKDIIPKNLAIDIILYEKSLTALIPKLFELIKVSEKNGNVYVKETNIALIKNNKPTCTCLTSISYLCRLGILPYPPETEFLSNKNKTADKIINILSEKFKKNENNVLIVLKDIIKENSIEYIFYKEVQ